MSRLYCDVILVRRASPGICFFCASNQPISLQTLAQSRKLNVLKKYDAVPYAKMMSLSMTPTFTQNPPRTASEVFKNLTTLSLTLASYSLVDFLTARIMMSRFSVLVLR